MWKKRLAVLAAIFGVWALGSYFFGFPPRFRYGPKFAAHSQAPIHASTTAPDNIVLTPAGDMSTGIRITWRTTDSVPNGAVQLANMDVQAMARTLYSPELTSDNTVKCFTAMLAGLTPETTYTYRVGSPALGEWSEYGTFTTAPAVEESFSFAYFGDTQSDPKGFGEMLAAIKQRHPETALYMMGGDLVDAGSSRNLWDAFMMAAGGAFANVPVAPALGNHDHDIGGHGVESFALYLGLPVPNRPKDIAGYSFRRGNVFFAVINAPNTAGEAAWLELELRKAQADGCVFKIVMFHEPVYAPHPHRNNPDAQKYLVPLFDEYNVDLVLNGHDHSYLRSKPLRAGKIAPPGESGTTYIVATACDKFYESRMLDIAERQFANMATYQLITVGINSDERPVLRYGAYSTDGVLVDLFERSK